MAGPVIMPPQPVLWKLRLPNETRLHYLEALAAVRARIAAGEHVSPSVDEFLLRELGAKPPEIKPITTLEIEL